MKKIIPLLLIVFIGFNGCTQNQKKESSFQLIKILEVDGRQGVAVDGNYYYVSGSKALYKYNKDGKLISKNEHPFQALELEANHLGDIDFYNGDIYAGVEKFEDGKASNIQIVVYDSETLKFKNFFKWNPESGQKEVCAITVDAKNKNVWMADWIDGSYLYKYDLATGEYLGKLHIYPVPEKQQGIKVIDDKIFITADDGDAEYDESDHLYSVSLQPKKSSSQVTLKKTFSEVKREGEIEGLTYDESTDNLIVHFNRGTRVINGMPVGFYPGYEKEIHELYIYKIVN